MLRSTFWRKPFAFIIAFAATFHDVRAQENLNHHDVVVYGGTSGGVIAAVQAKRMGKSVILVCPDQHLGGLSSGGLGWTDTGNKSVIGGLAREFYHRVWQHYQTDAAWKAFDKVCRTDRRDHLHRQA